MLDTLWVWGQCMCSVWGGVLDLGKQINLNAFLESEFASGSNEKQWPKLKRL